MSVSRRYDVERASSLRDSSQPGRYSRLNWDDLAVEVSLEVEHSHELPQPSRKSGVFQKIDSDLLDSLEESCVDVFQEFKTGTGKLLTMDGHPSDSGSGDNEFVPVVLTPDGWKPLSSIQKDDKLGNENGDGAQENVEQLSVTRQGETASTSLLDTEDKMGNTVDVQVMESVEYDDGQKRKSRDISELYHTETPEESGSQQNVANEPTSPESDKGSTLEKKGKHKKEKKKEAKKKEKKEKKDKQKKDKSKSRENVEVVDEVVAQVEDKDVEVEVPASQSTEPDTQPEQQVLFSQEVSHQVATGEHPDRQLIESFGLELSQAPQTEHMSPPPAETQLPQSDVSSVPSCEQEQEHPVQESVVVQVTVTKEKPTIFEDKPEFEETQQISSGWTMCDPKDDVLPPCVDRVEPVIMSPTAHSTFNLIPDAIAGQERPTQEANSPELEYAPSVDEDTIEPEAITRKKFVANEPISVHTEQHGLSYQTSREYFGQSPKLSPISPLTPSCGVMSYSRPESSLGSEPSPTGVLTPPRLNLSQVSADVHHGTSYDHPVAEDERSSVDSGTGSDPIRHQGHFVVVAIDFGTTFSGYCFSFTRDPESIHMMRKWEGGDPGVINQKTPTCLLMTPSGEFHSFGFAARDFFHDLDPQESKKWLYFEKFKMALHYNADLGKDTMLKASNGKQVPALSVFSYALRFFKEHALQELTDQSATKILNEDVRWVITVPAIWKEPAKHFMRTAAYQAGIASSEFPDQLLIALEPEAASIFCRKLRMHQLVPDVPPPKRPLSPKKDNHEPLNMDPLAEHFHEGVRYMVVDCGGGTVDMTVHEIDYNNGGGLKELWKATGGPYGSVGVDIEFERLLTNIFGADFMYEFKRKRPAGYVDLMIAFESRKRTASPWKANHLNVSLPFSFIDYYKKYKGSLVENGIRKYGDKEISWSTQGMMRFTPDAMRRLFLPTLDRIKQAIGDVLNNPAVKDVKFMFLVGGFAESPILQHDLKQEFGHLLRIIIPQDVSQTILKGAVLFGLDPTVVTVRRCRMTYGVGVLNRFVASKHPNEKRISKDGHEWCTDVFDKFVSVDQSVALGDTVLRSYTPAKPGQKNSIINVYCSERNDVRFITDQGVKKCGTLCLDLSDIQYQALPKRREIQTRMTFGDTEIKVSSLDVATGKCVKASIDFLNK